LINDVSSGKRIVKRQCYCLKAISSSVRESTKYITSHPFVYRVYASITLVFCFSTCKRIPEHYPSPTKLIYTSCFIYKPLFGLGGLYSKRMAYRQYHGFKLLSIMLCMRTMLLVAWPTLGHMLPTMQSCFHGLLMPIPKRMIPRGALTGSTSTCAVCAHNAWHTMQHRHTTIITRLNDCYIT